MDCMEWDAELCWGFKRPREDNMMIGGRLALCAHQACLADVHAIYDGCSMG